MIDLAISLENRAGALAEMGEAKGRATGPHPERACS